MSKSRRSDKQRSAAFEKFNNKAVRQNLHVEALQKKSIFQKIADKFKVK